MSARRAAATAGSAVFATSAVALTVGRRGAHLDGERALGAEQRRDDVAVAPRLAGRERDVEAPEGGAIGGRADGVEEERQRDGVHGVRVRDPEVRREAADAAGVDGVRERRVEDARLRGRGGNGRGARRRRLEPRAVVRDDERLGRREADGRDRDGAELGARLAAPLRAVDHELDGADLERGQGPVPVLAVEGLTVSHGAFTDADEGGARGAGVHETSREGRPVHVDVRRRLAPRDGRGGRSGGEDERDRDG